LKQSRSTTIGIVVKGRGNPMFGTILDRVQTDLRVTRLSPTVEYINEMDNEVNTGIQLMRELRPGGLLFLGAEARHFERGFEELSVPSVAVSDSLAMVVRSGLSSVFTDDKASAARAIGYLASRGHRRIGIVGGQVETSQTSRLRLEGCEQALKAYGIDFDASRDVATADYSLAGAYAAAGELIRRCPELTALFCMSDRMAMGSIRALRDDGLSVPHDVSVMGFDGIDLTGFYVPRITTIRQDERELATRGVDLLLRHLAGDKTPQHLQVPFTLAEGESVAAPATRRR
jgi:LacI family transcriptional regulator